MAAYTVNRTGSLFFAGVTFVGPFLPLRPLWSLGRSADRVDVNCSFAAADLYRHPLLSRHVSRPLPPAMMAAGKMLKQPSLPRIDSPYRLSHVLAAYF